MRSLLVHLDASQACGTRLQVARRLAARHGASVTALFAVVPGNSGLPTSFSAGAIASTAELIDIDGRHHARAALEKWLAIGGPPVAWAESVAESPLHALARQALYADMLVLGKRDPSGQHADQLPHDFAESVVIESGKAALVVPDTLNSAEIGHTVLIAWKASRESSRSVAAALPILRGAKAVHVVMWRDKHEAASTTHHLAKLNDHLRQHGVDAQMHALGTTPLRIGEAILSETQRHRADMLVMGCYGRSRARELLLGGASRSVLRALPVPVLMAH